MIGSFFLPPLGTILGALAGWGLGALAKQSFINAKKQERAFEFATKYLDEYRTTTRRELTEKTSETYAKLQDSLRTKEDKKRELSDQEMGDRIEKMIRSGDTSTSRRGTELKEILQEYKAARTMGGLTHAEDLMYVQLKDSVQRDILENERWIGMNADEKYKKIPFADHIGSFQFPLLNNNVKYEKIEIPENKTEADTRLMNLANFRYMAGKILWDMMEDFDSNPLTQITL